GIDLEFLLHLLPDVRERILPRAPCSGPRLQLAGELAKVPILPCRLLVHVGPQRGGLHRLSCGQQRPQPINLPIRDHAHGEPPCRWRSTITTEFFRSRNCNCRRVNRAVDRPACCEPLYRSRSTITTEFFRSGNCSCRRREV